MHSTPHLLSLADIFSSFGIGKSGFNTNFSGLIGNGRLGAHPDDVVNIHIVAKQNFFTTLKVDQTNETGMIEAEKVGKMTILPVTVDIGRVIKGCVLVGRENSNAFCY